MLKNGLLEYRYEVYIFVYIFVYELRPSRIVPLIGSC
jgi:hypothetical protein